MRKAFYFLSLFVFLSSCNVNKKPVFIKVDELQFLSFKGDTIHLKANAFFKNPNNVSGKIATDEIKVILNSTEIAQVSSDEFKVPALEEFTIPLKVAIPSKMIFENNKNGILGGLLNSILNRSVKIQFKGVLKYKVFGFSSDYPVDISKNIKIKL